ncbi:MAG TPA: DUF948 domain-containing protein [bacterium]|nr:DUF948 domain-containing protein [bacterium]
MIFEICIIVVSITFVVLAVYLILTVVQMKRMARAAEHLLTETRELASETHHLFRGVSRGIHALRVLTDSCGALRVFKPVVKDDLLEPIVFLAALVKGLRVGLKILHKESQKRGDDHV